MFYNAGTNTYDLHYVCYECQRPVVINVNADDWKAWQHGELIQNAMPYLSSAEREIMISGICGDCFDKLFPPDLTEGNKYD